MIPACVKLTVNKTNQGKVKFGVPIEFLLKGKGGKSVCLSVPNLLLGLLLGVREGSRPWVRVYIGRAQKLPEWWCTITHFLLQVGVIYLIKILTS